MNRLYNTVRIVSATVGASRVQIDDLPKLIHDIYHALPSTTVTTRPMPCGVLEIPAEAPESAIEADKSDSDITPVLSWSEALAASRARFSGHA